jgi:flagellar hook-basal body complex protein FliE
MSNIPTFTIRPSDAANAYASVDRGAPGGDGGTSSFGSVLQNAVNTAIETGHTAENDAMQAISGQGSLTDVVTALAHAQLALETATAVRDRVVQAYQDVMKMPI